METNGGSESSSNATETVQSRFAHPLSNVSTHDSFLGSHESGIIRDLAARLEGGPATANYCCGGTVPAFSTNTLESPLAKISDCESSEGRLISNPVTLRWDSTKNGVQTCKIQFPLSPKPSSERLLDSNSTEDFFHSFGQGGRLDKSQFSVDFNPHSYGILDAINQIMVPGIKGFGTFSDMPFLKSRPGHRGVVAELQHVNVLTSSTSEDQDQFHSVPRGGTQFGTLVVCLPCLHLGGELTVDYNDDSTKFDWSHTPIDISWAAFYNGCGHKVQKVTCGHQVTLTYNLYLSERIGSILPDEKVVDVTRYPLYRQVEKWITDPEFFKDGGILGFYCQHRYSHNEDNANKRLPYALEGVDAIVFGIFRSFGYPVHTLPIVRGQSLRDHIGEDSGYDANDDATPDSGSYTSYSSDPPGSSDSDSSVSTSQYQSYNLPKHLLPKLFDSKDRNPRGGRGRSKKGTDTEKPKSVAKRSLMIGDKFHDRDIVDTSKIKERLRSDNRFAAVKEAWPMQEYFGIVMANRPKLDKGWDTAVVEVTVRDAHEYISHAGIFVEIPKVTDRLAGPSI